MSCSGVSRRRATRFSGRAAPIAEHDLFYRVNMESELNLHDLAMPAG
jgi:hypothetical protein